LLTLHEKAVGWSAIFTAAALFLWVFLTVIVRPLAYLAEILLTEIFL